MPEKNDDAGGLSPTKEENAFWRYLGRREIKGSVMKSYRYKTKGAPLPSARNPTGLQLSHPFQKIKIRETPIWSFPVILTNVPTLALSKSGSRVEGHTFLSACLQAPHYSIANKNRRHPLDASCKKSLCHDFLRRHYPHQVKGSKFDYFLSACFTSSPVFVYWLYYTSATNFVQLVISTKTNRVFL